MVKYWTGNAKINGLGMWVGKKCKNWWFCRFLVIVEVRNQNGGWIMVDLRLDLGIFRLKKEIFEEMTEF